MESLALFVLPNDDEAEEEFAWEDSINAELSGSESGAKEDNPENNSLELVNDVTSSTEPLLIDEIDLELKFAAKPIDQDKQDLINVQSFAEYSDNPDLMDMETTSPKESKDLADSHSNPHLHHGLTPSNARNPPSFMFRTEEIAEHPQITPRTERRSWRPPISPGWSYSLEAGISNIYGHCDGQKISWLSQLLPDTPVYKQYSIYYAEGTGFWVLKGDGRAPPKDEDWERLGFDTYGDRGLSYLTNAGQSSTLYIQPDPSDWAYILLQDIYHSRTPATPQRPGGLIGELPIFLGLLAFSTTRENLQSVLQYMFVTGQWNTHPWQTPCK